MRLRGINLTPTPWAVFDAPKEGGSGGGDPPAGGGDPPKPPKQPQRQDDDDPTPGQQSFSHEYVRELRAESKGYRLKMTEERQKREAAESERDQARSDAEKARKDADTAAEQRATDAETKANERIVRSELRTLALKAGMVDLDGLKLADLSAVKLNDKDELEGGEELIAKLKEAKPYLFGQPKGTSDTNTKPPAPPGNDKPKRAKEMTKEEYEAAKRAAAR